MIKLKKMVEFCDDCGSIIMGKKGMKVACPSCGKETKSNYEMKFSEKLKETEDLGVIDNEKQESIHPIVDMDCERCDCKKVYFWTKQMRSGDEPETQFFKCTNCDFQWRDYS